MSSIAKMQRNLNSAAEKLKRLKRKRAAIKREYVPYVKNPLIGYSALFGEQDLRDLGRHKEPGEYFWNENYRDLFFQDIRYRSKLRKIRDRIVTLENEYGRILTQIKQSITQ